MVDRNAGLTVMGMDSLMAVEFRNRITKTLGDSINKALPATLIFNYPNINAITDYLLYDVLSFADAAEKAPIKSSDEIEDTSMDNITDQELIEIYNEALKKADKNLHRDGR
jgi:phthiocerol/phenolphthiocerol synthesis type-I polyketide synthase B